MKSPKVGTILWVIIAVSLSIHVLCLIVGRTMLEGWRWQHYPLHSAVEMSGALIAFLVAAVLISLQRRGQGTSFNVWIAGALIGMGLLDGFHSLVHAGQTFVWLHSTATLTGGTLFVLVWLPRKWADFAAPWWHWAVVAASFTFGLGFVLFPGGSPAMVHGPEDEFTFWAQALNVVGGLFFFTAAMRLVRTYFQTRNVDDLLFCLHCSLFGAAAIMFEQSQLWDLPWWGWHLLRLMAYAVALWFVIRTERREQVALSSLALELRELNKNLDQRARDVTLELQFRNEELERANTELERTNAELVRSRSAALNILQDIDEARRKAENAEKELKRFAAELSRSNAELEQFAYVASHDLQEPLRKVQSFADLLASRYHAVLDPEGQDYLQRMHDAATRMKTLINDLLTYARLTSKARPFETVDLNAVARDVVNDLDARIQATGGHVELGELPTVEADPIQMRQLVQNLIGNGLKYHRPGTPPLVRVGARWLGAADTDSASRDGRDQKLCQITVQDNGIGFDEKYAERIFVPFQRLHTRSEYEGTGMGLAVCRKIVERHGGSITVRSSPGEGSSFIVTLPGEHTKGSTEI